jgi:YVTN family beta-propeller protein
VIATIPVGAGPDSVAVTPDGKKAVIVNNGDWTISLIDTQSKQVTATILMEEVPYAVTTTLDGKYAYVALHGMISIIDIEQQEIIKTLSVGEFNVSLATSPDGEQVYVASPGLISVIGTDTQTVIDTIPFEDQGSPYEMMITPDGKRIYVATHWMITVIDIENKNVVDTISFGFNFSVQ